MSVPPPHPAELADGVRAGDARALARAITLVEDDDPAGRAVLAALLPDAQPPYTIGVTGPPGAGKSTLVSALARAARAAGRTVAVVAVDPTSPFGDGALLGDRVRLSEHFLDPGVFIRSMASRRQAGGLGPATLETLLLLGAAGSEVAFLETVGAGQGEVAVLGASDTVLLVLMPGAGDSLQALKAGIMEIPDVIALNKHDLPGAERARRDLGRTLALGPSPAPALVTTAATLGQGTDALFALLERRRAEAERDGSLQARRAERLAREAVAVAAARARRYLENAVSADAELAALLDQVRDRRLDPLSAADAILAKLLPPTTT